MFFTPYPAVTPAGKRRTQARYFDGCWLHGRCRAPEILAAFFKGEYEKYTWSRIFDPKLGEFELITLYSEAIATMNHNENIPQLFRDIVKNAFLPYRDPEILKSFLKEINEFKYDHSEKLGDAGQFRTLRHIIDFIVSVVYPKKNESILDPACGTAGFLISSFKHKILLS